MPAAQARLHDGAVIDVEIAGDGQAVLLPVRPDPIEGLQAEQMRQWGVDPALGRNLIHGLADGFRVVAFDYEGHVIAQPKPDTLTPDNVANDLLAIADAAGVGTFAYYGYSWLALCGLQLAIRTNRLNGLAMGGFPPLGGPYAEMLAVTEATHRMSAEPPAPSTAPPPEPAPAADGELDRDADGEFGLNAEGELDWDVAEVAMSEPQTRQFATLYRALRGFYDTAAQQSITCARLCFAGSADTIVYGPRWGGVTVDIAGPLLSRRVELESLGWQVHIFDGLDHIKAMQAPTVLSVLRPWLDVTVGTE